MTTNDYGVREGMRFGRLVAVEETRDLWSRHAWWVRCDCGSFYVLTSKLLVQQRSCNKCSDKRHNMKHGGILDGQRSYVYRAWQRAKQRGHLCEAWFDAAAFIAGVGAQPKSDYGLLRPDRSRPYGPDNFVWAHKRECLRRSAPQARYIRHCSVTKTTTGWARYLSMPLSTLRSQLDRGWTLKRVLEHAVFDKGRDDLRSLLGLPE